MKVIYYLKSCGIDASGNVINHGLTTTLSINLQLDAFNIRRMYNLLVAEEENSFEVSDQV